MQSIQVCINKYINVFINVYYGVLTGITGDFLIADILFLWLVFSE